MRKVIFLLVVPFFLIGLSGCNESNAFKIAEMEAKEKARAAIIIGEIKAKEDAAASIKMNESNNATELEKQIVNNRLEQYMLDANLLTEFQIAEMRAKAQAILLNIETTAANMFWKDAGKPMVYMFLLVLVFGFVMFYGFKATTSIFKALADMRVKQCDIESQRFLKQYKIDQDTVVQKHKFFVTKFIENKGEFSKEQQDQILNAMTTGDEHNFAHKNLSSA